MNNRVLLKWKLILPWIYVITGVYYLTLIISYFFDLYLNLCSWGYSSHGQLGGSTSINCPAILTPYEFSLSGRDGFLSLGNGFPIGIWTINLIIYIIASVLFIKWIKQVKLLPDSEHYKNKIRFFSALFFLAPILILSGSYAMFHTFENGSEGAKTTFRSENEKKTEEQDKYLQDIAKNTKDLCPNAPESVYIASNNGYGALKFPKGYFSGKGYVLISHENEWDGTFKPFKNKDGSINERIFTKSDKVIDFLNDSQAQIDVNNTRFILSSSNGRQFFPKRTYDIWITNEDLDSYGVLRGEISANLLSMPSGGNCLTVKVKEEEWTNAENDEIMEKIHNAWENNKQNDACLKTTRDVFVENNINLWARKLFSRTMDDNSPIDAYLNRSSEYSVLHFPKTIVSGQGFVRLVERYHWVPSLNDNFIDGDSFIDFSKISSVKLKGTLDPNKEYELRIALIKDQSVLDGINKGCYGYPNGSVLYFQSSKECGNGDYSNPQWKSTIPLDFNTPVSGGNSCIVLKVKK